MNISDLASLSKKELESVLNKLSDYDIITLSQDPVFSLLNYQLEVYNSEAGQIVFIGGRGCGKSHTGSVWVSRWINTLEDATIGIVSKDLKSIKEDILKEHLFNLPNIPKPITKDWTSLIFKFPNNVTLRGFTAVSPDGLRGPNINKLWMDEIFAWEQLEDTYNNGLATLRKGNNPQCLITSTPRRCDLIEKLLEDKDAHIIRATTFDNVHLSDKFLKKAKTYLNTSWGRQEYLSELMNEDALWQPDLFKYKELPSSFDKIIIAIDPAVTANNKSDETGIIVAGKKDNIAYIIDDLSGKYDPRKWAHIAIEALNKYNAKEIIAESNQGGDLVKTNILAVSPYVKVNLVRATKGKEKRAEPVVTLFGQNRVFLSKEKTFNKLIDQCIKFSPSDKNNHDDRMDALVWAIYSLLIEKPSFALAV